MILQLMAKEDSQSRGKFTITPAVSRRDQQAKERKSRAANRRGTMDPILV